jgi:DNA helicase HerA-like ATPase
LCYHWSTVQYINPITEICALLNKLCVGIGKIFFGPASEFIDEAHHFLKSKKRVSVLENIIREIRSKGASVMLLSQSSDDYDQTEFNFLELLEFVYVLESNPSSPKFLQQSFGLSLPEAKKLMRDVTELNQGEAFGKSKQSKITRILLCR